MNTGKKSAGPTVRSSAKSAVLKPNSKRAGGRGREPEYVIPKHLESYFTKSGCNPTRGADPRWPTLEPITDKLPRLVERPSPNAPKPSASVAVYFGGVDPTTTPNFTSADSPMIFRAGISERVIRRNAFDPNRDYSAHGPPVAKTVHQPTTQFASKPLTPSYTDILLNRCYDPIRPVPLNPNKNPPRQGPCNNGGMSGNQKPSYGERMARPGTRKPGFVDKATSGPGNPKPSYADVTSHRCRIPSKDKDKHNHFPPLGSEPEKTRTLRRQSSLVGNKKEQWKDERKRFENKSGNGEPFVLQSFEPICKKQGPERMTMNMNYGKPIKKTPNDEYDQKSERTISKKKFVSTKRDLAQASTVEKHLKTEDKIFSRKGAFARRDSKIKALLAHEEDKKLDYQEPLILMDYEKKTATPVCKDRKSSCRAIKLDYEQPLNEMDYEPNISTSVGKDRKSGRRARKLDYEQPLNEMDYEPNISTSVGKDHNSVRSARKLDYEEPLHETDYEPYISTPVGKERKSCHRARELDYEEPLHETDYEPYISTPVGKDRKSDRRAMKLDCQEPLRVTDYEANISTPVCKDLKSGRRARKLDYEEPLHEMDYEPNISTPVCKDLKSGRSASKLDYEEPLPKMDYETNKSTSVGKDRKIARRAMRLDCQEPLKVMDYENNISAPVGKDRNSGHRAMKLDCQETLKVMDYEPNISTPVGKDRYSGRRARKLDYDEPLNEINLETNISAAVCKDLKSGRRARKLNSEEPMNKMDYEPIISTPVGKDRNSGRKARKLDVEEPLNKLASEPNISTPVGKGRNSGRRARKLDYDDPLNEMNLETNISAPVYKDLKCGRRARKLNSEEPINKMDYEPIISTPVGKDRNSGRKARKIVDKEPLNKMDYETNISAPIHKKQKSGHREITVGYKGPPDSIQRDGYDQECEWPASKKNIIITKTELAQTRNLEYSCQGMEAKMFAQLNAQTFEGRRLMRDVKEYIRRRTEEVHKNSPHNPSPDATDLEPIIEENQIDLMVYDMIRVFNDNEMDSADRDNADGDYPEGNYADGDYIEGNYADEDYVDDADYTNGIYAERNYADGNDTDGNYADNNDTEGNYADADYTEGNYADADYTEGNYADGDYTERNYADEDYTEGNYADADYTEGNYADSDYTEENYADGDYTGVDYPEMNYLQMKMQTCIPVHDPSSMLDQPELLLMKDRNIDEVVYPEFDQKSSENLPRRIKTAKRRYRSARKDEVHEEFQERSDTPENILQSRRSLAEFFLNRPSTAKKNGDSPRGISDLIYEIPKECVDMADIPGLMLEKEYGELEPKDIEKKPQSGLYWTEDLTGERLQAKYRFWQFKRDLGLRCQSPAFR